MFKIDEKLRKKIQESINFNDCRSYYDRCDNIEILYKSIKLKEYNNYKSFLDLLVILILSLEELRAYNIANTFIDIMYDIINNILDNMKEDWDLTNETINRKVKYLFNKLKKKNKILEFREIKDIVQEKIIKNF